ncbi:hypothetical protein QBC36DRAFT_349017 [Triangularia setosa]|uniref:C2H2-type domain-containing protein n=1 Tax=Triangularia setosa TaxID=2587417 RepID=A0AAN6W0G1_9PEZI|nr:hypothetical protein QBC36DRAFT_349017 [Podospora setosa]
MAMQSTSILLEQLLKRRTRQELVSLYIGLGEYLNGHEKGLAAVPELEDGSRPSSRLSTATTIAEVDNMPSSTSLKPPPVSHQRRPGRRSLGATTARPRASSPAAVASKEDYLQCPLCSEVGAYTACRRKNDLKRHMRDYHNTDTQWVCPKRGCGKTYDCAPGMKQHLKEPSHGNLHHFLDCVMTKLCPRVVFACGFTNCKHVFEAPDATDSERTANEYFNHVASHVEADLPNHTWSYSTCFRNLMRQPGVDGAWKNRRIKGIQLKWQPHTSSVLRKMLETRHVPDRELLVVWAVRLGSKPYSESTSPAPRLPAALCLPVFEQCECGVNSAPQSPYQPNPSPGSPQVPDSLPDRSAEFDSSAYSNRATSNQNVNDQAYTMDSTLIGVSTSFDYSLQGGYSMGVPAPTVNQQPALGWSGDYYNGSNQDMSDIDPALLSLGDHSWIDFKVEDVNGDHEMDNGPTWQN